MEDKKVLTIFKPIASGILLFLIFVFFCARQQQQPAWPFLHIRSAVCFSLHPSLFWGLGQLNRLF
jgi:hypothetical protein